MNILTLLNDDIHTAGYNAVKSIIFSVASDAIATQILSKSPSVKTQAAIKTATKVLSNQAITLTTSNKLLSNQVTNLSASNKRIQDSFVKLTSSNAVLLSQNHKLTTSNLELENKHANMQSAYKKTIQKVTKRISVRSVANASRNAAAVTGEAVPVIGTALIVGVTAWDIYDACETLKDVNELSSMVGQEQANLDKVCGIKIPSQEQVLAQVRRNWRAAYQSAAGFVNTAGANLS